nr:MAG TPA: hypothetical protein [Caudoviricetes sp.]
MKHNIISVSSIAILTGSFTAAGILSGTIPTLGQVVALIVVTLIGGVGAWVTYPCRGPCKEKAPDERQLSQGADRKIFNFILTEEAENGKDL